MKALSLKLKALAVLLFLTSATAITAQKIIGYIPQYRTTAQMDAAIEWDKMTDYYYFGSIPTTSGGITLEQSTRFDHVKAKATTYGKNVWLSCGGWNKSSAFITVANSASLSQTFANNALAMCTNHGLTGIDIDWEFPAYGQETAFKNFFKILYETLNPAGFKVSAAAGGEAAHADKWQADLFNYIDDLNIMSYDASAGYSNHASLQFMKDAMTLYNAQGCPYSKMLGGVAFYSRCAGVLMYSEILNGVGSSDKPGTFANDLTGGYCYNGKTTIEAKVDYVMGLGGIGVLIWEVTQDILGTYSLLGGTHDAMDKHNCSSPGPNLGTDQSICGVSSITLDGGVSPQSGVSFTWKKGATTLVSGSSSANTYAAVSSGTYTLEVWKGGCNRSDVIEITGALGSVSLGGPYDLCAPISVTLNSGVTGGGKTFEWQKNSTPISGSTGSTYEAKTAGTYKVIVSASGCSSINGTATVTSSVPSATNDTTCIAGDKATITASESVNWYSSSSSSTVLTTGTTYEPSPSVNTTYWMGGTGAASVSHTTMKTAFSGGWQANSQVYGNKLIVAAELTMDEVYVNAEGGNVVVNLVANDGTTVVKTKTFSSVSGETALNLGWTAIPAGTYYLNAVGTTGNLWVDNAANASDHEVAGVITIEKQCYADWGSPYGSAYVASSNYGNFFKLKVTVGSSCDRVPVEVIVDGSNAKCILTSTAEHTTGDIQVYPNPSSNVFTAVFTEASTIKIVNLSGIKVEEFNSTAGKITFGKNLKAGIYFVNFQTASGIKTIKVVKRF
jgi:hypothetical protein